MPARDSSFKGFAALGRLAAAAPAATPLDLAEVYELFSLRERFSPSMEQYVRGGSPEAEHAELAALRATLARELEAARVQTAETPTPWHLADDPLRELIWRRPLAEAKVKAEEEAREEKARLKREADEERLAGLRARRKAEADAAKAAEQDAEKQRRAEVAAAEFRAWQVTQHDTFTPAEARVYARILHDRDYNDTGRDDPPDQLAFRCPNDCGKLHWSYLRAVACFIVREEAAEARRAMTPASPTRPVQPAPRPAAAPAAASSTRPVQPAPRPAAVPTAASSTRPVQPAPRPAAASSPALVVPPVDYAARILLAVERAPLRSARAVFQETGGNKPTVFETVKLMLGDGRLVTDSDGIYRVGNRARRTAG